MLQDKMLITAAVLFIVVLFLFFLFFLNYHRNNIDRNDGKSVGKIKTFTELPIPTPSDHYRWKTNSPYTLVVYFSLDCIYCKKFDLFMDANESRFKDKFNLVYRQAPLSSLLESSSKKALIVECVYNQMGDDVMFKYINYVYSNAKEANMDNNWLINIAYNYVTNRNQFDTCLNDVTMQKKITDQKIRQTADGVTGVITLAIFKGDSLVYRYDRVRDGFAKQVVEYLAELPSYADQYWDDAIVRKLNR